MTKVLYLAEPIDQARTIDRSIVFDLLLDLKRMDWAVYRPVSAWQVGQKAEPGPVLDDINREAVVSSDALVAYLPEGVPTIGVAREIELARSCRIPVAVLRPEQTGISWALQDVPMFSSVVEVLLWLAKIEPEWRGVAFQVGPDGQLPQRAHAGDAGYDLFAAESVEVPLGKYVDIRTDVSAALPPGVWARITGRSSTLRKRGLLVIEGVVDSGYRGELYVGMVNLMGDGSHVSVRAGERLAQLIPHINLNGSLPAQQVDREQFERIPAVDGRGANGFGSSGT